MSDLPEEKFAMWARVDLMGHNQRVGNLTVVNTGVEVLYRLDIPLADGGSKTEFYGKGAVYSIQPVTEDVARLIAAKLGSPAPISTWDLPDEWRAALQQFKALPATTGDGGAESEAAPHDVGDDYERMQSGEDEDEDDEGADDSEDD